jgi:UDP-2-acetamido-2,6-beta-L-arabino-hexul-4-ose reductase
MLKIESPVRPVCRTHLYNSLGLRPDEFERIDFQRSFLIMKQFGYFQSDVIVHLAAMNRLMNRSLFTIQYKIGSKLTEALIRTNSKAHVYSLPQLKKKGQYVCGKSKRRS